MSGEADWPLFVHGPAGTGKSCAALALLDHVPGEGIYHTAASLCETLTQAQQGRLQWYRNGHGRTLTAWDVWKLLEAAPLVVVDELGARERVSDHHYEAIKRVLDDRHGRPLVMLSNFDLAKLGELYDDRIASRLAGGTVVKLEGRDRRVQATAQTAAEPSRRPSTP